MRDISTILKKGNLSAKKRALIYISSKIEEEKTGKKVLDAQLMEAIKDPKAFINDRDRDTFNNHVNVWVNKGLIDVEIYIQYSKAYLTLGTLKVLAFIILKSSLISSLLKVILEELHKRKEEDSDVCFNLGFDYIDMLNPFLTIKPDSKSGKKAVDLEENLKSFAILHINNFLIFYKILLALQKVQKTVSKEIGVDVSYIADYGLRILKENVDKYNQWIDRGLADFRNIKSSVEETFQEKDKVYADRKTIYLDLEGLTHDEKAYSECIQPFEELLGKKFWED